MMGYGYARVIGVAIITRLTVVSGPALAEEAQGLPSTSINAGDTAWILTASALVLIMIVPGLALFYGGLVRTKNVLATIMHSFAILCLVTLLWILVGYSLAFGPDHGGVIGGLDWVGLIGVGMSPNSTYAPTIPHQAFMIFQLMFAAITPALITGAFAERMRFSALLIFAGLWVLFIYCPIAHWIWGGRVARKVGRAGLCRRGSRPHQFGCGCISVCVEIGPPARLWDRASRSSQPSADLAGHRSALVWMVWF